MIPGQNSKNPFILVSMPSCQDKLAKEKRRENPYLTKQSRINFQLSNEMIPNFDKQTKSNRLKLRKDRVSHLLKSQANYNTNSSAIAPSKVITANEQLMLSNTLLHLNQNETLNESEMAEFISFAINNFTSIQAEFEPLIAKSLNLHKCLFTILKKDDNLKWAIDIVNFYNLLGKENYMLLDHLFSKGLMQLILKIMTNTQQKKLDLKFEFAEKAIHLLSLFISSLDEALKVALTYENLIVFENYFNSPKSEQLHLELLDFFLISVFVYKEHTSLSFDPYSEYFCCNIKILGRLIENLKDFCKVWIKADQNLVGYSQNEEHKLIMYKTLNLLISFSKICDNCNEIFVELDLHLFIAEAIIAIVTNQTLMPEQSGELLFAMLFILGNMVCCSTSFKIPQCDNLLLALNLIVSECTKAYESSDIAENAPAKQVEILSKTLYILSNISCDSMFDINKFFLNLYHETIFKTYHKFFKVKKVRYECIYVLCNISLVKSKEDFNYLIESNLLRIIADNFQSDSIYEVDGILLETANYLITNFASFHELEKARAKLNNYVIKELGILGFIDLLEKAKSSEYELIAFKAEQLLIQHFTISEEVIWDQVMQEDQPDDWEMKEKGTIQESSNKAFSRFISESTAMCEDFQLNDD